MMKKKVLLPIILLLLAALACATPGTDDGGVDSKQATLDAIAASVEGTSAASSSGPSLDEAAATAAAEATHIAAAAAATKAAAGNASAADQQATRDAFGSYLAELPNYGVDPNKGRPAWIHPPLTLETDAYLSYDYGNNYVGTLVENFVVSTEITWNTQYGTSGCGFAFRSNGDEEALDQYMAIATRGGNGRVLFSTMQDGEVINFKDIYAYGIDPNFDWHNDTTNKLTIVARGPIITIYTNGTFLDEFNVNDPPKKPYIPPPPAQPSQDEIDANPVVAEIYKEAKDEYDLAVGQINQSYQQSLALYNSQTGVAQYDKGFLVMLVAAESGKTTCQFNNTWLFLIEE